MKPVRTVCGAAIHEGHELPIAITTFTKIIISLPRRISKKVVARNRQYGGFYFIRKKSDYIIITCNHRANTTTLSSESVSSSFLSHARAVFRRRPSDQPQDTVINLLLKYLRRMLNLKKVRATVTHDIKILLTKRCNVFRSRSNFKCY